MKRFVTALGMCALMVTTAASADTHTWDGGDSSAPYWIAQDNWVGDVAPISTDDAVIDNMTNRTPELYQNQSIVNLLMRNGSYGSETQIYAENTSTSTGYKLSVTNEFLITDTDSQCYVEQLGIGEIEPLSCTITAGDTNNEHATLEFSAGTLDVLSVIQLNSSTSCNAEATLVISDPATFTSNLLDVRGGDDPDYRRALLYFDSNMPMQSDASNFDGDCDVFIGASKKFTSGNMRVGSDELRTAVVIGSASYTGEFELAEDADISIEGGNGSGEYATLTVSYGTLDASHCSRVRIREGTYSSDHSDYASFVIGSNATAELDDVAMQDDARLTVNANTTVGDDFELSATSSTAPSITLGSSITLTINGAFAIEAGASDISIVPTFNGGSISAN